MNREIEAEAIAFIDGPHHLNNVLLGLTPLKPKRFRVFDSRFGIRLPYQGALFDDLDEWVFTPPSLGPCVVSIRGAGFGRAARFDATMFIGPPIEAADGPEILIRHADFLIRMTRSGAKFETERGLDDVQRSLEQHAELARALSLLKAAKLSSRYRETRVYHSFHCRSAICLAAHTSTNYRRSPNS
ncbi:hypothetical protein ACFIOY_20400 [Bradyrhizobium sp. TZ2]